MAPDLFPLDLTTFQGFLLVFVRMSALFGFLPIFGGSAPKTAKAGLALTTSFVLFPLVDISRIDIGMDVMTLALLVTAEALVGLLTAYLVTLMFAAIQMAGYIIGFQIGFGIVNVVDPSSGQEVSIVAQFMNILAMLLFLSLNIHHFMLLGFAEGFRLVPPGVFHPDAAMGKLMVDALGGMLMTAAQLSAPITVGLLLKQLAMGILARTVSQMNIFVLGFPITIAVGLFALALLMAPYRNAFSRLFMENLEQIDRLFGLMV
ncbi:MAG: flagellar biosynthetic protein FliR [Nitrospinae bacterium]|nr:flagellar biosynthetic protein FliR [Nitrospinota bacterium]